MTVKDFLKIVRHYLWLVIVIPVLAAAVVGVTGMLTPPSYVATATIGCTNEVGGAGGISGITSTKISDIEDGIIVKSVTDMSAKQIRITATGADGLACIDLVNQTALDVRAEAARTFPDQTFKLTKADAAYLQTTSTKRMALAAAIGGFFVALCLLLIWEACRRPVVSASSVKAVVNTPLLGTVPRTQGPAVLGANLRLITQGMNDATICFVPVNCPEAAQTVAQAANDSLALNHVSASIHPLASGVDILESSESQDEAISLVLGPAPQEDPTVIFAAQEADAIVLCVQTWKDSQRNVESAINELGLAEITPDGVILLQQDKKSPSKEK